MAETPNPINDAPPSSTLQVENLSEEEALFNKLTNADTKKCSFEEIIIDIDYAPGRWLQVSQSVYGMCVHQVVQRNVPTDIGYFIGVFLITFLGPCLVIGFVQGYLIYKLLDGTPQLEDTEFCANENTRFLFTCIIGVFLISMEPGLQSIFNELTILLTSKISFRVDWDNGRSSFKLNEGTDLWSRFWIFLIILYEFVVWMGVLIAGVKYILSIDPQHIGDVIQGSVAIGFIDQIDDMALFLYRMWGEQTKTDYFRCNGTIEKGPLEFIKMISTIPILLSCAFGIVYGLHDSYC